MSKRRRTSSITSRGMDDDEDSQQPSEPTRKKKKIDPTDVIQQLYDTIRNYKKSDGSVLCDFFIRAPKRRQEPAYYEVVANPIDLLKVQQKIKTDEYEDVDEFMSDIELLVSNTKAFYKRTSQEYKDACELWELVQSTKVKLLEDPKPEDEAVKVNKTPARGGVEKPRPVREMNKRLERGKTTEDAGSTSEGSVCLDDELLSQCEDLFTVVMSGSSEDGRSLNSVFQLLPSRKLYPKYYEIIDQPIDLRMIARKIQQNKYSSLTEMEKDLLLMCKNATIFNEPGSQIYKDAKTLRKLVSTKKVDIELGRYQAPNKASERIRTKRLRTNNTLSAVIANLKTEEEEELGGEEEEELAGGTEAEESEGPCWQLYTAVRSAQGPQGMYVLLSAVIANLKTEEEEDLGGKEEEELAGGAEAEESESPCWQLYTAVRSAQGPQGMYVLLSAVIANLKTEEEEELGGEEEEELAGGTEAEESESPCWQLYTAVRSAQGPQGMYVLLSAVIANLKTEEEEDLGGKEEEELAGGAEAEESESPCWQLYTAVRSAQGPQGMYVLLSAVIANLKTEEEEELGGEEEEELAGGTEAEESESPCWQLYTAVRSAQGPQGMYVLLSAVIANLKTEEEEELGGEEEEELAGGTEAEESESPCWQLYTAVRSAQGPQGMYVLLSAVIANLKTEEEEDLGGKEEEELAGGAEAEESESPCWQLYTAVRSAQGPQGMYVLLSAVIANLKTEEEEDLGGKEEEELAGGAEAEESESPCWQLYTAVRSAQGPQGMYVLLSAVIANLKTEEEEDLGGKEEEELAGGAEAEESESPCWQLYTAVRSAQGPQGMYVLLSAVIANLKTEEEEDLGGKEEEELAGGAEAEESESPCWQLYTAVRSAQGPQGMYVLLSAVIANLKTEEEEDLGGKEEEELAGGAEAEESESPCWQLYTAVRSAQGPQGMYVLLSAVIANLKTEEEEDLGGKEEEELAGGAEAEESESPCWQLYTAVRSAQGPQGMYVLLSAVIANLKTEEEEDLGGKEEEELAGGAEAEESESPCWQLYTAVRSAQGPQGMYVLLSAVIANLKTEEEEDLGGKEEEELAGGAEAEESESPCWQLYTAVRSAQGPQGMYVLLSAVIANLKTEEEEDLGGKEEEELAGGAEAEESESPCWQLYTAVRSAQGPQGMYVLLSAVIANLKTEEEEDLGGKEEEELAGGAEAEESESPCWQLYTAVRSAQGPQGMYVLLSAVIANLKTEEEEDLGGKEEEELAGGAEAEESESPCWQLYTAVRSAQGPQGMYVLLSAVIANLKTEEEEDLGGKEEEELAGGAEAEESESPCWQLYTAVRSAQGPQGMYVLLSAVIANLKTEEEEDLGGKEEEELAGGAEAEESESPCWQLYTAVRSAQGPQGMYVLLSAVIANLKTEEEEDLGGKEEEELAGGAEAEESESPCWQLYTAVRSAQGPQGMYVLLSAVIANLKTEEEEDLGGKEEEELAGGAEAEESESPCWQLYTAVRSAQGPQGQLLCEAFLNLPSKRLYPDYYEEIRNPISLAEISQKLQKAQYGTVSEVAGDLNIMFENAKNYNRPDSKLYKDAVKLQKLMQKRVQELLEFDHQYSASDDDSVDEPPPNKRPKTNNSTGGGGGTGNSTPVHAANRLLTKGKYLDNIPLKKRLYALCKCLMQYICEDGRQPMLMFMEKPSVKLYPEYYDVIEHPIDMLTIENNIKNEKYQAEEEILADFKLMFRNCRKFNEEGSLIYKDAVKLEKILMEKVKELGPLVDTRTDREKRTPKIASPLPKPRVPRQPAPAPPPPLIAAPQIRLDPVVSNKMRALYVAIRDYKDKNARQLSQIFQKLPSKTEYPDYYEVIKKPINIESISQKLKSGQYEGLDDLSSDFTLMFDNACKYNEPDSQIYKDALTLQKVVLQTKLQLRQDEQSVPDVQAAVQELLLSLFITVYNHQDEEGRCFSDSMQELPEHDEVDGKKVRALSLDLIKRRLDSGQYKRLDQFQEDVFACFQRARNLSRTDSQVFEDSIELQSYFIRQRDELCRNGDLLHSPALNYTLLDLSNAVNSERVTKQAIEMEEEDAKPLLIKEEPGSLAGTADNALSFNQQVYRIGDFVYAEGKERGMEPIILNIQRLWTNQEGQQMLYGNQYYRPNETYHLPTRKFLEKEVFKTDQNVAIPLNQVLGRCCVLSVKDYFKSKPEGVNEKDIYVCESRYIFKQRSFKKIKNWPPSLMTGYKLITREVPLEPKRVVSVFRERIEKHKEELTELEEQEKIEEKQKPNVALGIPNEEGLTYYEQLNAPSCTIKTGDFVYMKADGRTCVAQADTIWTNASGEGFFKGPWVLFPAEVTNLPNRLFYKNEVFMSTSEESHSVNSILSKCVVLEHGEYISCRPTEIPERDVYLCESLYEENSRLLSELSREGLKKYSHSSAEVTQDEIYFFRRLINPPKISLAELNNSVSTSNTNNNQYENLGRGTGKKLVTGYVLYSGDVRKAIAASNPEANFGEVSRIVGNEWRKLGANEKAAWEERAARINEETERMKNNNEESSQQSGTGAAAGGGTSSAGSSTTTTGSAYETVFECQWENCDWQFEDLTDAIDHAVGDPHGHILQYFANIQLPPPQEVEFQCQWRGCTRTRKTIPPFPSLQRLVRHVREVHMLKNTGRMINSELRSKNYLASRKAAQKGLSSAAGGALTNPSLSHQSPLSGVGGLQSQGRSTPSPIAQNGIAPVANGRITEPLFVTVPPRTQRLLHSEAYIKYIEGLTPDNRHISNWEKQLAASQESMEPPTEPSRLPVHWLNNRNGNQGNILNALWTLRDFMFRDALGISKHL